MMKSFFRASVATVVSAVMVIGMSSCGRSESGADSDSDAVKTINSSKATGDLTIWAMGNEGDLLDDFAKGFEKENPDVKVKVTAIPWSSAHDKLQTAIAAGNGPDLAQMGTTWMADFSNSFSTVPDNLDMSDFSDGSRAAGQGRRETARRALVHRHPSAVLPYRHRRDGWLEQSSEDVE